MAILSLRAYARHRGCTLRAVQKAIEAGRITVQVDDFGKSGIDPIAADKAWGTNTDLAKQSLLYGGGLQIPVSDEPEAIGADPDQDVSIGQAAPSASPNSRESTSAGVDPDTASYRRERAAREAIKRETEQIELDRLRNKLIDVDDANRVVFTSFRSLRDSLLNIGPRIKDQLASELDAFQTEKILDAELSAVLGSFDVSKALSESADEDDEG